MKIWVVDEDKEESEGGNKKKFPDNSISLNKDNTINWSDDTVEFISENDAQAFSVKYTLKNAKYLSAVGASLAITALTLF